MHETLVNVSVVCVQVSVISHPLYLTKGWSDAKAQLLVVLFLSVWQRCTDGSFS
jgi:hypothetical protein